MTIDRRQSVVPDDMRPAGRELSAIVDQTRTAVNGSADRDSGPETLYLEAGAFERRLKRSAVS